MGMIRNAGVIMASQPAQAPGTPAAPKTPSPFDEQYKLGPDSQPQTGVPEGKVTEYDWNNSKVFPGTERKYWVYVPAQYDAKTPAGGSVRSACARNSRAPARSGRT